MTEQSLSTEGLQQALQHVREKWQQQGARFLNDVRYGRADITGLFVFDEMVYEVVIQSNTALEVYELDDDVRRPVRLPPGLKFPKGFVRLEGYDR